MMGDGRWVMAMDNEMGDAPLFGIDYCAHMLTAGQTGRLTPWAIMRDCPICLRRWWLAEARLHHWTPLPHAAALPLFEQMATALVAGATASDRTAQGFYAYLATAPAAEADFAAAGAAARQDNGEHPTAPGDFGWRALFTDPAPATPTVDARQITRVWQWRTAGTMIAGTGRAFIRGETPPPFLPIPLDRSRAGGWLREGVSDAPLPLQRQFIGPLLLTLTAGDRADELHLMLHLRDSAGTASVPVRLYLGAAAGATQPPLAWAGILSEAQRTQRLTRPRRLPAPDGRDRYGLVSRRRPSRTATDDVQPDADDGSGTTRGVGDATRSSNGNRRAQPVAPGCTASQ